MIRPRPRRAGERGLALVAALWAAAIFAVVVLGVMELVRANARVGRGDQDAAVLNAAAEAGVNIAILALFAPPASQPPVNGVPFGIAFDGRTLRVTIQDEMGKVDLNAARPDTLRRILAQAGFEPAAATALAARLSAWHDGPQPGAGEAAAAAPLQAVEELQRLPDMTASAYRRLAPLVTVYSQSSSIDPAFAGLPVLDALRQDDPGAQAAWRRLEEQRAGREPPQPRRIVVPGHAFTITAEASDADARAVRSAVVRITGQPAAPLLIYRWN